MKHKHHLVPKHRGGTDADGLVECSITRHAMFHFCEWQLHKHPQDLVAWKSLTQQITGGEKSRLLWKGKKHSPKSVEKMRKPRKNGNGCVGRVHSEETKKKISLAAKKQMKENHPSRKEITIRGVTYRSLTHAREVLGVPKTTYYKRVREGRDPFPV